MSSNPGRGVTADTPAARRAKLLTAPIVPTVLKLAASNVVLALLQAFVSVADAYFIGQLGTDALAGVALVFPIVILMQMMSVGAMGGGVSSSIARALGAGNTARAERLAWHAVLIAVLMGILFTLCCGRTNIDHLCRLNIDQGLLLT